MATFYAKHHLYPDNPQLFIIDVKQIVKLKGESNTKFFRNMRGEEYWEIAIHTSAVDSSGNEIGSYWADVVATEATVHELVSNKVNEMCQDIDWTRSPTQEELFLQQEDKFAPIIYWTYPSSGQVNVPINSTIVIRLRDVPPAKGIDISTLTLKVNGYDVVPTIHGNKYDYEVSYKPNIGE